MIYQAEQISACFAEGSCLTSIAGDVDDDRENHPAATPRSRKDKLWVVAALIALGTIILFTRLHTYDEPLERDITTYAVIAHQMLKGKALYSEVWDHKPPAIHATYVLAELIAGYGRSSIFLMNLSAAVATMVACYFAGAALSNNRFAGVLAATIWTVVCGELGLEANQPNTEVFINLFLTAGFAVVLKTRPGRSVTSIALLAGSFFAIASLYKQVAIFPVAFLSIAGLLNAERDQRANALRQAIIITAAGALAWALVFGYFSIRGRSDAFIDATFIFNSTYAGNPFSNFIRGFDRPPLPLQTRLSLGLLAVLTLGGLLAGLRRNRRQWLLLLAFAFGTYLAVLFPGQFFAHYYQLWLPVLVIGSAWSLSSLWKHEPGLCRTWLGRLVPAAAVACFVLLQLPYYFLPPNAWSFRKYGTIFIETDDVARQLQAVLRPNETFYEWGDETGLYFSARHDPSCGVFFIEPLLRGPLQNALWQRTAAELERTKPDVLLLEDTAVRRTSPEHPALSWMKLEYREISRGGRFVVLARKGSRIERLYGRNPEPPRA